MEGDGNDSGQDREVSAVDSKSTSGDGEFESEDSAREMTPEAEVAAPIALSRATTSISSAGISECGVFFEKYRVRPFR